MARRRNVFRSQAQRFCLAVSALTCVGGIASCGGPAPAKAPDTRGIVSLQCDVADAEVWVNGHYFREVAELRRAFRLRIGEHRIEVRHDDYHSRYYELDVTANSRHTLRVELAEKLP